MNIVEQIIKYKLIIFLISLLLLIGGAISYLKLNKIAAPILTSKTAMITTFYPGASPLQVENDVTEIIESALKQFPFVNKISSVSAEGKSIVTIALDPTLSNKQLPHIWQILKDKTQDLQNYFPNLVEKPIINTNLDEVYGILLAITGNGFTDVELKNYADLLKQKISIISGVEKIIPWGVQTPSIDIYFPQTQLAQLRVSENEIYATLKNQNLVTSAGNVIVDNKDIRIRPISHVDPLEELGNLVVQHQSNQMIHLNDIANISKGTLKAASFMMRHNGNPAIGLAISTDKQNIIKIGNQVKQKINELKNVIPAGVEIDTVFFQPDNIKHELYRFNITWVASFILLFLASTLILGVRSGLIQSVAILVTFSSTMIILNWFNIDLQPVALGALIIALCLCVDNSLIVNQEIIRIIKTGKNSLNAAIEVVQKNSWLLLGGTLISILAFFPIHLSYDMTGEYAHSLFIIILVTLLLSWLVSITITPLFCTLLLSQSTVAPTLLIKATRGHKALLKSILSYQKTTLFFTAFLLLTSIIGFGFLKQSLFPYSYSSQFLVHYWLPQGSQIELTNQNLQEIDKHLSKNNKITSISTFIGGGAPKFLANYSPENSNPSYGLQIVNVKNSQDVDPLITSTKQYIAEHFPDAKTNIEKFKFGPSSENYLTLRFIGQNFSFLRQLADSAIDTFQQFPGLTIQTNWRNQIPVIHPNLDEVGARISGVTKTNIANALEEAFSGRQIATYQDQKTSIPIIAYRTFNDQPSLDNLYDVMIWSPVVQKSISIQQVIKGVEMIWENPFIFRDDQEHSIDVQGHYQELNPQFFKKIKLGIQNIQLPSGYVMVWKGEHEHAKEALSQLTNFLPIIIIAIAFILILFFNQLRQPMIILAIVPLIFIGIMLGLWITQTPFGFMPFLGLLAVGGIILKHAMLFVKKFESSNSTNQNNFLELLANSTSSFYLPIFVMSVGIIPLLTNNLFRGMAITLIFGLLISGVLIGIIIPVLYSLVFNVTLEKKS